MVLGLENMVEVIAAVIVLRQVKGGVVCRGVVHQPLVILGEYLSTGHYAVLIYKAAVAVLTYGEARLQHHSNAVYRIYALMARIQLHCGGSVHIPILLQHLRRGIFLLHGDGVGHADALPDSILAAVVVVQK